MDIIFIHNIFVNTFGKKNKTKKFLNWFIWNLYDYSSTDLHILLILHKQVQIFISENEEKKLVTNYADFYINFIIITLWNTHHFSQPLFIVTHETLIAQQDETGKQKEGMFLDSIISNKKSITENQLSNDKKDKEKQSERKRNCQHW